MVRECLSKSPIVGVGQTFVTKFGNVRLIQLYDSSSGMIGIKPNGWSEVIFHTVDGRVEDVGPMTVKTLFFTLAGGGCHFWVCGPDVPAVTPTPVPTPTPTPAPTTCRQEFRVYDGLIGDAPGATVTINGIVYTTNSIGYTSVLLTVGKEYTATGKFGDRSKTYTFTACRDILKFRLTTIIIPDGFLYCEAYDSVTNAVLNATIVVDGVTQPNKTPGKTWNLPPGTHTVAFNLTGYLTKIITAEVRAAETIDVTVRLVRAYTPTPTPAPTPAPTPIPELTGTIHCTSQPTGATIKIKDLSLAVPFYLNYGTTNKYYIKLKAGKYTVQYSKAGYKDYETTITVIADKTMYVPAALVSTATPTPTPVPTPAPTPVPTQTGKIHCTTNPTGAVIQIKDMSLAVPFYLNYGLTNKYYLELKAGTYVVRYTKAGYNEYVTTITVIAGKTMYVPASLSTTATPTPTPMPTPSIGYIRCQAYDSVTNAGLSATIRIDGQTIAPLTPHTTPGLPTGEHTITFIHEGYLTKNVTVTVRAGETVNAYGSMVRVEANVGFIYIQARDSVSRSTLNATVQIDGTTVAPETPFTTQGLSPGNHTITYILSGYVTQTVTVNVVFDKTVYKTAYLVKEVVQDVTGFDVKINISGLLPKSSLHIQQVVKVPFTDTWWNAPLGHGMRWDNIGNGVYKARGRSADSSPTPAFHTGFDENEDYAVYVGTSAVAFYPGSIIHRSTGKVTEIDLTSSYIDWVSSKVCATFGISPANCPFFIATSVNDAAFLLELWSIITKHENLAGEHTLPTALDYALIPVAMFGLFSPGISEGAIASMIGKRFGKLIELSKKGAIDVKELAQDPRLSTFMLRATDSQFGDLILHLEEGNVVTAKILLGITENISPSNLELNALDRAVKLTKKTDESLAASNSVEKLPTILSRFSDKFAVVYNNAVKWATAHPTESVIIGIAGPMIAAIAYIMDQSSINYDSLVQTKGIKAGDTSWTAKNYIDVIDTYMFNVKDAEKAQDWDAFCENLALWKAEVDKLKAFILVNGTTLRSEGTYDVLESSIHAYYKAIEIKEKVHTCVHVALPETIIAEVVEILDSDTVRIRYVGSVYTVRLLGINSPESGTYTYRCTDVKQPYLVRRLLKPEDHCINEELWYVDNEFYIKTKEWIGKNLPRGSTAIFKTDLSRQFDDDGRLLAVPFYNGKNVCMESLEAGQSVVFFYDVNKHVNTGAFLAAEAIAKDAKVGVWAVAEGLGSIRCVSYPTAAEVWLDGEYTGKKTISSVAYLYNVPVGEHTIQFKKIIDNVDHACTVPVTVAKGVTALASCSLVSGVTPTPTPIPGVTPTPTPAPEKATWQIGDVKNEAGAILGAAKVYVDDIYVKHYAPELLTFCTGCSCDTIIPCGFGTHTVTIKKSGFEDWSKTRSMQSGYSFTDNPVMKLIPLGTFPVTFLSQPSGATIKVDGNQI